MTSTAPQTSTVAHQALYRRWRAQTFGQIVGQEPVVETLRNAVRTDRVAHAILFVGPRGTGKTSLARILAKAVNCTNLQDGDPCDACPSCVAIREGRAFDLVEIDAASNRGIDAIRELRERIHYAPSDLRRKVYILDEAHQITKDAWNALLKSLEEPPDFVTFMFASTHPQEFPPAILSRLQRYDVRRLTVAEIEGKLARILAADNRAADPEAITLIAKLAAGGMRDAESMLDQLLASSGDRLEESRVRDLLGLAEADTIDRFVDALVGGDAITGIALLDALEERGRDARVFLDQVVDAIRGALVGALSAPASARYGVGPLAAAARRLAAIDPNRAGTGGLRLQLELALFAGSATEPAAERVPTGDAPVSRAPQAAGVAPVPTTERHAAAARAPVRRPQTDERAAESADPPAAADRSARAASAATPPPEATVPTPDAKPDALPTRPARTVRREARSDAPVDPPAATGAAAPPTVAAAARLAAPSTAATTATNLDLTVLLERWSDLVASVGPATRAVISECRPLSVEENVVTLGFPEAKAFLKDHAERKRPDLEAAVGKFLGRAVAVRCVATNVDIVAPVATDDDGAYLLNEARRIFAEDLVDVGEVN